MTKFIDKATYLFSFILFSIILIFCFVYDSNVYYSQNKFISLAVCIILGIIWFIILKFINKFVKEKVSIKVHTAILIGYFIIVSLIQIFVLKNLFVSPGWDYQVVFENAKYFVENGNRANAVYKEYFEYFPNNIMLFYLLVNVIKFGGILGLSALKSSIIFNIILIDLALFILYIVLNKKFNFKVALFGLIISLFFLPLFLYTPVFYSDTFSLFIGISFILIYLFIDKEKVLCKKNIILFSLMGLLMFLAKEIKITSLFILIAILIDYIFNNKNIKRFLNIVIILVVYFIFSTLFNFIVVNNEKYEFKVTGYGSYPYTHWIMMGVEDIDKDNSGRNSIGGYNENDYKLSRAYPTGSDAIKFNLEEFKNRVEKLGFQGYCSYLMKKGVNAWGDGLYFSDVKLSVNSKHYGDTVHKYLFEDENTKYNIVYFTQGVQFIFLLSLILGSIYFIKNKKDNIDYCRLSLLALLAFLLLWENRSRYLFNYIPIFILIICELYYYLVNKKTKKEKNICNEVIYSKENGVKKMKKNKDLKLYVVIPCYNEEEVLGETTKRLKEKLNTLIKDKIISKESKVMYVNDGSKDNTWELIKKINKEEELFTGITLSRNRGHQNALVAGLLTAKKYADVVISMDADLQDDINAIDGMLEKYNEGCEIVYGVRSSRKKDTFFKKVTAEGFYKFMSLMGVDIVFNHADYRLTSKRVLDEFENYKEVNLFLRGMFPLIGFKSDIVYYERAERFAGESKYPLKKMLNFAWDGITSFSVRPLRMIMALGLIVSMLSFLFLLYVVIGYFIGNSVTGWTTIIVLICLFSGIQIFCIGIIGEYVGKMYIESKARPRYSISENLNEK